MGKWKWDRSRLSTQTYIWLCSVWAAIVECLRPRLLFLPHTQKIEEKHSIVMSFFLSCLFVEPSIDRKQICQLHGLPRVAIIRSLQIFISHVHNHKIPLHWILWLYHRDRRWAMHYCSHTQIYRTHFTVLIFAYTRTYYANLEAANMRTYAQTRVPIATQGTRMYRWSHIIKCKRSKVRFIVCCSTMPGPFRCLPHACTTHADTHTQRTHLVTLDTRGRRRGRRRCATVVPYRICLKRWNNSNQLN